MNHLIISADDYGLLAGLRRGHPRGGAGRGDRRRERHGPPRPGRAQRRCCSAGSRSAFTSSSRPDGRTAARRSGGSQLSALRGSVRAPAGLPRRPSPLHMRRPGIAMTVGQVAAERGLPVRSVDEAHRRLLRRLGVAYRRTCWSAGLSEAEPVMPPELEAMMMGRGASRRRGRVDGPSGPPRPGVRLDLRRRARAGPAVARWTYSTPARCDAFAPRTPARLARERRLGLPAPAACGQLLDRVAEVVGQRVEVGHRLVVADQAEVDLAVVAHDPEADGLPARPAGPSG